MESGVFNYISDPPPELCMHWIILVWFLEDKSLSFSLNHLTILGLIESIFYPFRKLMCYWYSLLGMVPLRIQVGELHYWMLCIPMSDISCLNKDSIWKGFSLPADWCANFLYTERFFDVSQTSMTFYQLHFMRQAIEQWNVCILTVQKAGKLLKINEWWRDLFLGMCSNSLLSGTM